MRWVSSRELSHGNSARSHGFVLHKGVSDDCICSDCGVLLPWDMEQLVRLECGRACWHGVLAHDVVFLSGHFLEQTLENGRAQQVIIEVTESVQECQHRNIERSFISLLCIWDFS